MQQSGRASRSALAGSICGLVLSAAPALAERPSSVQFAALARQALDQGQTEQAERFVHKALELEPGN